MFLELQIIISEGFLNDPVTLNSNIQKIFASGLFYCISDQTNAEPS